MADDLANNWGVDFCIPENQRRPLMHSPNFRLSSPQVLQCSGDRSSLSLIPGLVAAETHAFRFERVAVSGSQANSWAINDATHLDSNLCLFGAGSYVAGDGSALQAFSTSDFSPSCELALVVPPTEVKISCGRSNTVPLPYHIPGVQNPEELMKYEDDCFRALHTRLCWAKMQNKPYKAILLELILAGNGATLSNRALIAIAKLARYHQLCVLVDEIMTGGRTGYMFFLLSKPPSFQAVVTHITLGKFTKLGMVFVSASWSEKRARMYPFVQRGASTSLGAEAAVLHWTCVKQNLADIPKKREKVLNKLKMKEEQVWGSGLLLFGPCRWDTIHGLKCRYLPLIHEHTPIDSVHSRKLMPGNAFRVHVNSLIVHAVYEWIGDVPQPTNPCHIPMTPADKKRNLDRQFDFSFISKVVERGIDCDEKQGEEWMKACMPATANRRQGEAALARLESAGGVQKTQVGRKRKRCWKLEKGFVAPWKTESDDYDDIVNELFT